MRRLPVAAGGATLARSPIPSPRRPLAGLSTGPTGTSMSENGTQKFGIIGLEVMGRNIALNIERNGYPIAA